MYKFILSSFLLLNVVLLKAQDTITVQTLTFQDITKRRGVYQFPTEGEYQKILMYQTLKCDARTTQDKYPCGEWDYLTYTYVYDHNATYDSTFSSTPNFKVNEQNRDTFYYTTSPVIYNEVEYLKKAWPTKVKDSSHFNLQKGTRDVRTVLPISSLMGRSQVLWKAADLTAAGLKAGELNGVNFTFLESTESTHYKLRLAQLTLDSLVNPVYDESKFSTVAEYVEAFDSGQQYIHFSKAYTWDGTSDLLFDISFQNETTGNDISLEGDSSSYKSVASTFADGDYALNFGTWRDFVRLGSNAPISGSQKRTIEAWVKVKSFNNGGLFQAGSGSVNKDFSLKTTNTDNRWRMQLSGSDGDANFTSKNEWHHLAMTYDEKNVKLFVDGVFFRQITASLNTSEFETLLGRWNNNFLNGEVDEVRIWKVALPATKLKDWMGKDLDPSHPNYKDLLAYYKCNEGSGDLLTNETTSINQTGTMLGSAWWKQKQPEDLRLNWTFSPLRPNMTLVQGDFETQTDSIARVSRKMKEPVTISFYENGSRKGLIDDNAANHPKDLTKTIRVWQANYGLKSYNETLGAYETIKVASDSQLIRNDNTWYSPTVRYEIARYITPYGINLSLGPKGFTWVYDVTDYADLLKGEVDLSSGNQQELIDLKFVFIKGKAPRKVIHLDQIWPYGSMSYRSLSDDSKLAPVDLDLANGSSTYKVKTRLTGHGHNSDNGQFPHCCEWKNNTHYMYVNGKKEAEWSIWREDCDRNPLYPQGGTWPGAREGWCPGDVVTDNEFEITDAVGSSSTVNLDYRITEVPSNNLGMGNGNYVQNMELWHYSDFAFKLDAAVYDVIRPTNWEYRAHINPSCEGPIIEIRNNGSSELSQLDFEYWVEGNVKLTHQWTGTLKSMEKTRVQLPIDGSYFWVGTENVFNVKISKPNGAFDEYTANDVYQTRFELPEIYDNEIVVQLRTNELPEANRYEVRDATGKVVYSKGNLTKNTTYQDTLNLKRGCYTFHMFDDGTGLSYWAYDAQGTGYLKWRRASNFGVLKEFEPDFGEEIQYGFAIGAISTVEEKEAEKRVEIYPNPSNGLVWVDLNMEKENAQIEIFDAAGNLVASRSVNVNIYSSQSFNLSQLQSGVYLVKVSTNKSQEVHKLILN